MKCAEVRKFIDAYVDRELDPQQSMRIEEHTSSCVECSTRIKFIQKIKSEIRVRFARVKAPAGLYDRIQKHRSPKVLRIMKSPWAIAPVAAAACFLAVFVFIRSPMDKPATDGSADNAVVADIIKPHLIKLPLDIKVSDQKAVSEWFKGRVNFPVRPPAFRTTKSNLLGARLSNVRHHQAAQLSYDINGKDLSVTIFHPDDTFPLPKKPLSSGKRKNIFITSNMGYTVAVFRDRGITYAVSGDIDEQQMRKMISSLVE